jgi:hypothetical protein
VGSLSHNLKFSRSTQYASTSASIDVLVSDSADSDQGVPQTSDSGYRISYLNVISIAGKTKTFTLFVLAQVLPPRVIQLTIYVDSNFAGCYPSEASFGPMRRCHTLSVSFGAGTGNLRSYICTKQLSLFLTRRNGAHLVLLIINRSLDSIIGFRGSS